ncbi:hypothetical protein RHMOL_Rhmol08G0133800 [Rhododendron molle]|uniref:Uncharacterized protein n=1 Tax=Rhododendron molle TaxID=49168 RepID=A0ACC0MP29_RHOML|nr:hypothetical protein RHMOL_Rhmol08G0133800 [Rhododendron molle]
MFKTPEPVVEQSKGPDIKTIAKRRIQVDVDEDVCSPSPVKGFRSLGGLSRGRKRKLEIDNPILYVGGYDNMEVHYEPPRLRQADQVKKSHFQYSPFTKDGVKKRKKRNPPKKQSKNENFDKLDVNVPTILNLVAVQMTNAETLHYPDKSHLMSYLPVTVSLEGLHRKLVFQYGDLYQVDVTKFNIANVHRQPLQHDTDEYDCGLFVIKFMQGFNYPSGVHRMDDTERPRLLLELCGDENNRDALEVMKKFKAWKGERGEWVVKAQPPEEEDVVVEELVLQEKGGGRGDTAARGAASGQQEQ